MVLLRTITGKPHLKEEVTARVFSKGDVKTGPQESVLALGLHGAKIMMDTRKRVHPMWTPNVYHTSKQPYQRSGRSHYQGQSHSNTDTWKEKSSPRREMPRRDSSQGWFQVTIPNGRKYGRTWLLSSLSSYCSVPFTPVDFHYVRMQAQFFVQGASTASALSDINQKICSEDNHKISIYIRPSGVPFSVQDKLKPEQIEQIKLTLYKRYDVSQQALDLRNLRFDPDLNAYNIDVDLNGRNFMSATLDIIAKNFPNTLSLNLSQNKLYHLDSLSNLTRRAPNIKILNLSKNELKSAWELDKIKGLNLEELWLEGNPLCNDFSDRSTYMRSLLEFFPKLLCLDGLEMPSSINSGSGVWKESPACQENTFESETVKTLALTFLKYYYMLYDSEDRSCLLDIYHEKAYFSLSFPLKDENPSLGNLGRYAKDSNMMKLLKDTVLLCQIMKHTRRDIVDCLTLLARTKHDIASILVDVCFQKENMLYFSVNGRCKEERLYQYRFRDFTRTCIVIINNDFSMHILNDQIYVRDVDPKEIPSANSTSVPTTSAQPTPRLSQERQVLAQVFSVKTGMNLERALKYIRENSGGDTTASSP